MAWSEIKKAVNSDISTPLNVQILNALNSGKIIKHIQRGTWTGSTAYTEQGTHFKSIDITLNGFENAEKMIGLIEFSTLLPNSLYYSSGSIIGEYTVTPYLSYIDTNKITVSNSSIVYVDSDSSSRNRYIISSGVYTVIEFY
ncbi:MAG: hypothetical protein ACI4E1_07820 [Lachnospira sp.]